MGIVNTGVKLDHIITTTDKIKERFNEVKNGQMYFTKDTHELIIDIDNERRNMSSIIYADTLDDLINIPRKLTNKIYWEHQNNCGYLYINNTLTKIIEPSADLRELVRESFRVVFLDSLADVTEVDDHIIYCVKYTPADGSTIDVKYVQYYYNATTMKFERVSLTYDEVKDIADTSVASSLTDMEVELGAIRDSLLAGTLEDPSEYFNAISSFYQNVYTKDEAYNKTEIDTMLAGNAENSDIGLTTAVEKISTDSYPFTKMVADDTGIHITKDRAFYVLDMNVRNIIDFYLEDPVDNDELITVEVLVKNANQTAPSFNPDPKWVDNIAPTYDNDNILIGFRSFDQGITWIGTYQGGWDN